MKDDIYLTQVQKRWTQRRLELLQTIQHRGGRLPVNTKRNVKTYTNEQHSKDIRRLLKEGYAKVTGKSTDVGRKNNRYLILTREGMLLLKLHNLLNTQKNEPLRSSDFETKTPLKIR